MSLLPKAKVLHEPVASEFFYRGLLPRVSRTALADSHLSPQGDEEAGLLGAMPAAKTLGWRQGVLIPCLLNIWGGIMFLRLGWVVGQSGIWLALLTLVLSYVVTTSTALSLCAIVTNGEVKGGGIYFLVGRSMGPKWGSMLGLLFFWAQVIAAAMYSVGVAEVVADLASDYGRHYFTGDETDDVRVISVLVLTFLLAISFLGMGCFAKTQTGLFATMMVAILAAVVGSFFHDVPSAYENRIMGFVGYGDWKNDLPVWSFDPTRPAIEYNFFTVFAVFFPAATGIMAGANVSGDLAKPSSAIPKGTLAAIAVSFLAYFGLIFILGLSCDRCVDEGGGRCPANADGAMSQAEAYLSQANGSIPLGGLLYNKIIMANLVPVQPFFFFGVFASSLSSALSSLVSAPRILQAMARDPVFPFLRGLAKGSGANNEPVRALIFSYLLALCFALIGNLDAIATLITNVFLASYALVNLACFVASSVKTAGWHPTFTYYNKWVSLLGAILCVTVMFLIDYTMCLATLALCLLVYLFVGTLRFEANWGAADDAVGFNVAMAGIESVQLVKEDNPKLYRVSPLVMAGAPGDRPSLLKFASMLSKTRGLTLVGDVVLRTEEAPRDRHLATAAALLRDAELVAGRRAFYDAFLNNGKIWGKGRRCPGAFPVVALEDSLFQGFVQMLQTAGIGKLRPNSVLFGFPTDLSLDLGDYEQMLRVAFNSDLSGVMILRDDMSSLNVAFTNKPCCHSLLPYRRVSAKTEPMFEPDDDDNRGHHIGGASESDFGLSEVDDLPFVVNGEFIDIWWLGEDGGFSVLIPQVLAQHDLFYGKRLRVFVVVLHAERSLRSASISERAIEGLEDEVPSPMPAAAPTLEELDPLEAARLSMVKTLAVLRIKAHVVAVDGTNFADTTSSVFRGFKLGEFARYGLGPLDNLGEVEQALTVRYLNMAEQIRSTNRSESNKTAISFITAPVFITGLPNKLYTCWLDILSKDMPGVPVVFIRGSGQQLLQVAA